MKNKIIYLVLLLLLSTATTSILAQEECGTELTQVQIDYMNATREARKKVNLTQLKSNTVTIIPMVAHIVRNDDGSGGLSTADLSIGMVDLNRAFEQVNFEFELCEINYIDNTAYTSINYSTEADSEEFEMATNNRVDDKVNVFFTDTLRNRFGKKDHCGWASFPSYVDAYGKDWVLMKNECTVNGSTLPHELGHWFNLYHTHQGNSNVTTAELVTRGAGKNCGPGVGDELCDTPADPGLTSSCMNKNNCAYRCSKVDDNGDVYAPNPNNLMSYAPKTCRTFFSPQQIARVQASYEIDRGSSLSSCTTSFDCEITSISVNNTGACNDNGTPNNVTDDYFVGDVSVNYLGKPNTGKLYLVVTGGASDINTADFSDYGHTFTGVHIPVNEGQAVSMTAVFSAEPSCRFTDDVNTGRNCGPCNISEIDSNRNALDTCQDNDTPNDATDDFFVIDVDVYYQEKPTSGHLVIEGGVVNRSVPVSQLSHEDDYHTFYDVSLPANNTHILLTAKFSEEPSCSKSQNFSSIYPCSIDGICDSENAIIGGIVRGKHVREVNDTIAAFSKIQLGADVTYIAGRKITLKRGFYVKENSKFHAYIEGCDVQEERLEEEVIDNELTYLRNYPNPFTGQTTIEFELSKDTPVTLFVSDVTGRQVAVLLNNDEKTEGTHTVIFDGNNYPPGMYYYTIQAGEYYGTQKMILAK